MRDLVRRPELSWRYDWAQDATEAEIPVDMGFAGCRRTRRSTSGGVILLGGHALRHWYVAQATIALSSGEAEMIGIVRGAAQGLGLQSTARDLGCALTLHRFTDAKSAIGFCRRRGLGRIRHLSTTDLLGPREAAPRRLPAVRNTSI